MKHKPKIDAEWLKTHEWMLRSSNNGISYGGFKWPGIGRWIECPDWNDYPNCGGGFHGNASDAYGHGFDYSRLELCEIRGKRVKINPGNKIKAQHARIVACNRDIPDAAFEACGYTIHRVAKDCEIAPQSGEMWIIEAGNVTAKNIRGGYVSSWATSTLNVETVSGGNVSSWATSTLNVETVSGGYVSSWDTSTLNVETVSGGDVRSWDTSTLNVETVSGGYVSSWATSTLNVESTPVSGGYVSSWATSTLNVETVSGGYVSSWDTSTLNVETVSGGDVRSWDTSTLRIKNKSEVAK